GHVSGLTSTALQAGSGAAPAQEDTNIGTIAIAATPILRVARPGSASPKISRMGPPHWSHKPVRYRERRGSIVITLNRISVDRGAVVARQRVSRPLESLLSP